MGSGYFRHQLKRGLIGVLMLLSLWIGFNLSAGPGQTKESNITEQLQAESSAKNEIKLKDQPFYPELEEWREKWESGYLGQVVDTNPRLSLIKFYSAMAKAGQLMVNIEQRAQSEPGWGWSQESRRTIEEADRLFRSATQTIDASKLPESIRVNTREEAALKLKEILDYVLDHSERAIDLPTSTEKGYWRLPNTTIAMASKTKDNADIPYYQFTQRTLNSIDRTYNYILEIKEQSEPNTNNPFLTPNFYRTYAYQPGYLVAPKFYLKLPKNILTFLEYPLGKQSLLQVALCLLIIGLFTPVVGFLIYNILDTYRYAKDITQERKSRFLKQSNTAWRRFLLIAPITPLVLLSNDLIDNKINITGEWLRKIDFFFDLLAYIAFGATIVLLFEAIGRTSSHWVLKFLRSTSDLERKRIQNVLLPVCRFLGAMTAVIVIYQLLLRLGMPNSTVLAFSAVPGLAIGLGASKLLGNIFAGISIQSDRPIRVGEFCQIGDKLGFVKRIGLRSIELATLSANVTIPNNKVDDTTIVNYTRRTLCSQTGERQPLQSIEYQLTLPDGLIIGQLNDITQRCSDYLNGLQSVSTHSSSYDEGTNGEIKLTVLAEVRISSWEDYLSIKQEILSDIKLIVAIVENLRQSIGIARDTPPSKIDRVPELIAEVVNCDANLNLSVCRLSSISDYSIDFMILMETSYEDVGDFFSALARVNRGLLDSFATNDIEIPLPTSVEIQKIMP